MLKFKEITRERKNTKLVETQYLISWVFKNRYPTIDNIFLPHNLVEHYLSPFLQKEGKQNVVKGLLMLKVQSLQNLAQKHYLYLLQNFRKPIFFTAKVTFQKYNNYSTPECPTWQSTMLVVSHFYTVHFSMFLGGDEE